MKLAEVQSWFQWAVTDTRGLGWALSHPSESPVPPAFDELASDSVAGARERLAVYAAGYSIRLREAVEVDFPALCEHIGDKALTPLIRAYARSCPSDSPSLSDFGSRLPRFLEGYATLRASHPYLADLARLEWAIVEAFMTTEVEGPVAPNATAWTSKDWMQAEIVLSATLRYVECSWPVLKLWKGRKREFAPSRATPQGLLVWRKGGDVSVQSLGPVEAAFLSLLRDGGSIGALIEGLAERLLDCDIQGRLQEWRGSGIVRGYRFGSIRERL